ncbi:spermidine synthase [Paenibacillus sepulcri]|uniref:Fused MFS/spermidine synthase n=1 Tax=Paenibacillus sepulcri TaxID=359917 RepID=A0ABS7C1K4_9BACL|nr:fused MFS/spermidine synthase [Paenibacillus sepulcri]
MIVKEIGHLRQLAREISRHQEIGVYEAAQLYGETGKYRFLQFSDHAVQGAIDLKDPKRIVLEYPRAMIHLMEYNYPSFEDVFVIGHGVGTIAGHYPDKRFKVAEIDGRVVELSREFFDYRMDNVTIGDGRELLADEAPGRLDYIILDAFTRRGTPPHLTTVEFFGMTLEKLGPRGSIMLNLMGKPRNDIGINAIHTTVREVYACTKAFLLPGEEADDIGNIIIMGSGRAVEFQAQAMAGFREIELEPGHIIRDKKRDF